MVYEIGKKQSFILILFRVSFICGIFLSQRIKKDFNVEQIYVHIKIDPYIANYECISEHYLSKNS